MPTILWHLALLATASASLVISEVADKGAADACDGEEWIELHNNGDAAAELAGGVRVGLRSSGGGRRVRALPRAARRVPQRGGGVAV